MTSQTVLNGAGLSNRRRILNGIKLSTLPAEELDRLIGSKRSHDVAMLTDWMIRNTRAPNLSNDVIGQLCDRLVALGLPLDRYGSSVETLDAEHDGVGRLWLRGQGLTVQTYVSPEGNGDDVTYLRSPFHLASETRQWVELWLPQTDDNAFGIVPELRAEGFIHYVCAPIVLVNGTNGWVTFATRQPSGFSTADLATIARIMPALAMVIDFRSTWSALQALLRTYVGTEPQQAILRGNTKRGQVSTIKSAMLFADMRDSVGHTADLSAKEAVGVFNSLFDCLVPPIEGRGGEVLKYIGDGLLAIFREAKDGACCNAAERALQAAEEALLAIERRNLAHPNERPIHVGIALHYGEAAYGNVGSGVRLDFTVIGRDVGLASRIAGMNRTLDEPLLLSAPFAKRLQRLSVRLGEYPARGFLEAVEVFRPAEAGEVDG